MKRSWLCRRSALNPASPGPRSTGRNAVTPANRIGRKAGTPDRTAMTSWKLRPTKEEADPAVCACPGGRITPARQGGGAFPSAARGRGKGAGDGLHRPAHAGRGLASVSVRQQPAVFVALVVLPQAGTWIEGRCGKRQDAALSRSLWSITRNPLQRAVPAPGSILPKTGRRKRKTNRRFLERGQPPLLKGRALCRQQEDCLRSAICRALFSKIFFWKKKPGTCSNKGGRPCRLPPPYPAEFP